MKNPLSKTQQVIDLVKELIEIESLRDSKLAELQALIGGSSGPGPRRRSAAKNGDTEWEKRMISFLSAHRGEAVKAAEICKDLGCPPHILVYYMKLLIEQKRVKRVKRGFYQLRGAA